MRVDVLAYCYGRKGNTPSRICMSVTTFKSYMLKIKRNGTKQKKKKKKRKKVLILTQRKKQSVPMIKRGNRKMGNLRGYPYYVCIFSKGKENEIGSGQVWLRKSLPIPAAIFKNAQSCRVHQIDSENRNINRKKEKKKGKKKEKEKEKEKNNKIK
ncbi:hypothetical protein POVCU1_024310 [Plasmodium ovale curtisi]|uniref:Uncharacterized protein n=1 Tax=Plasmodium ovale curtisi TaxID=864141 RepID=A0A1A8WL81_PLAOA|nr:hypothetical protein POVCU1_024310 [Plasmodium ovale curtisi]